MKDIPTEELAAISPEIHEAAVRVGCTHVNITGNIWPGAQASGRPEEAARFVEFSWLRAAMINGRAIFEDADPKGYAELLVRYGLEDAPSPEIVHKAAEPKQEEAPAVVAPASPEKIEFTVEIFPATKRELERQAKAEGISVGELLDWKFRPRVEDRRADPDSEQVRNDGDRIVKMARTSADLEESGWPTLPRVRIQ